MENAKIAKKLVAVMNDCCYVSKNGVNSFHHYKYATAEDVLQKVNEALTRNKLATVVHPNIASFSDVTNLKGNTEHLATVIVKVSIIDSESGESVDLYGIGSGQDAGDKAVMKAQTVAIKYAYMMSLCIATGDDPEADINTDENNVGDKPVAKATATRKSAAKQTAPKDTSAVCCGCGAAISEKVLNYSVSKFGQPLCMDCQKQASYAA